MRYTYPRTHSLTHSHVIGGQIQIGDGEMISKYYWGLRAQNRLEAYSQFTLPLARHDDTVLSVSRRRRRLELDSCSERVQTLKFSVGDSLVSSRIQITPPGRHDTDRTIGADFCFSFPGQMTNSIPSIPSCPLPRPLEVGPLNTARGSG